MKRTRLVIDSTWDGEVIGPDERVSLALELGDAALVLDVDAPFHGDPAPPGAPGSCDGLWEFEVAELFLLGAEQHYLEIELGPFGHYLALSLRGPRGLLGQGLPLGYQASRSGGRWRGHAIVPTGYLPRGLSACNAYAIHGGGAGRRYLAAYPPGGNEPDFHRLDSFEPLDW